MRVLCVIGLHGRIRDRTIPTRWGIRNHTDEYYCRRCPARWERTVIPTGNDIGVYWERVT